jgi:serine phosphatase RsbU (regulator of sigma subunit)
MSPATLQDVEHMIWHAQPHELAATAKQVIMAYFGASDVEILLADYRLIRLIPVAPERADVPIDNTAAGHAFAAQLAVPEQRDDHCHIHLPLTVHGDRLGILTVDMAESPTGDRLDELHAAAIVLGRALKIADGNTDVFRRVRRRARLTLAAEMQWELLPGRGVVTEAFSLAGQLEPAYAVWGDNFDWSATSDRLTLSVSNGMGSGTRAAALTHLGISAMRNARRSGAELTEQAGLADQMIFAHHSGEQYLATLLLGFDLETGTVRAVDAGSPQIYRMRGNLTEQIQLEAQLPLGMFGDTQYQVEEFTVEPGDRLIIVSDGVHAAQSPTGSLYGAVALLQALRETRLQNPAEAVRTFIRLFLDHHQGSDLADDAVIVCLDWTGKTRPEAERQRSRTPIL